MVVQYLMVSPDDINTCDCYVAEACKLHPSVMEVGLKNRALMIRKVARKSSLAPFVG